MWVSTSCCLSPAASFSNASTFSWKRYRNTNEHKASSHLILKYKQPQAFHSPWKSTLHFNVCCTAKSECTWTATPLSALYNRFTNRYIIWSINVVYSPLFTASESSVNISHSQLLRAERLPELWSSYQHEEDSSPVSLPPPILSSPEQR